MIDFDNLNAAVRKLLGARDSLRKAIAHIGSPGIRAAVDEVNASVDAITSVMDDLNLQGRSEDLSEDKKQFAEVISLVVGLDPEGVIASLKSQGHMPGVNTKVVDELRSHLDSVAESLGYARDLTKEMRGKR